MSILITGAGVIGCHTARMLAEKGERVCLLDIMPQRGAIATIVNSDRVKVVEADVSDFQALGKIMDENAVDRIIHTAAMLTTAVREAPRSGVLVNVMGTTNILELARVHKLSKVVIASSTTVGYSTFAGFSGDVFPEDFEMRVVSERPTTLYSVTKLTSEQIALYYHQAYGVDAVVVRYGAVLSAWPGQSQTIPGRMLLSLLRPAIEGRPAIVNDQMLTWAGGEEFVDARDCAQGNVKAVLAPAPTARVYNISCGTMYSFADVVNAVRSIYPKLEIDMRIELSGGLAGFQQERPAPSDISAAERDLGYRPIFKLVDSVRHFATSLK